MDNYVINEKGEKVIVGSRRPDGTLRKERKIRAGYTPQDEQPAYVSVGAQVGISPVRGRRAIADAPEPPAASGRHACRRAPDAQRCCALCCRSRIQLLPATADRHSLMGLSPHKPVTAAPLCFRSSRWAGQSAPATTRLQVWAADGPQGRGCMPPRACSPCVHACVYWWWCHPLQLLARTSAAARP